MLRTAGAAGKQLRFPGEIPGNCGRIRLRRKLPPSHSERVANGQRRFRSSQRLTKTAKNSRFCRMSPRSEEEIPSVEIEARGTLAVSLREQVEHKVVLVFPGFGE